MSGDLDQVLSQYREHLRKLTSLLTQLASSGQCDARMAKDTELIIGQMEKSVAKVMDKQVLVEKTRQSVLDLKMVLDITRQTVELKQNTLSQEEKEKDEIQSLRFKEFQRIHRLQDEKARLEKDLWPAQTKLSQLAKVLEEKFDKKRIIENSHEVLAEHCSHDIIALKDLTDESRAQRSKWDDPNLDVTQELRSQIMDGEEMKSLEEHLREVKDVVSNQKTWYNQETHTKLFYSTRSREIKNRINHFRALLLRMEKAGRSEDLIEDIEDRHGSYRPENALVDGTPGVQAKEVIKYLSQQFGMRVMADYTMLRRLKEEIGVEGLAYLVEKIRMQGYSNQTTPAHPDRSTMTWEERQVESALQCIAQEYRDRDENRRMLRPSGLRSCTGISSEDLPQFAGLPDLQQQAVHRVALRPSALGSRHTGFDNSPATPDSGRSSVCSKKRDSLSRFKKFLKLS